MTSGVPLWAYGAGVAIALAICTVNVLSALHDRPDFRWWFVAIDEFSSGLVVVALLPLAARLMRLGRAPATAGWPRFVGVHALGVALFSVLHVGAFILLRKLAFGLAHQTYVFGGPSQWLYEFRKDVLTYGLICGVFAFARALQPAGKTAEAKPPPPASFDIRDGARVLRTPVADILAATSAGNYVEFHLADGRKPLMRTTLAAAETELSPHGFVRTHRSWLVNRAHVREIAPAGTGDTRLTLDGGLEAPLSRRYPQALEALRSG